MDIQECFRALLQKYGDAVLKEEPGKDTTREAKAPKLEGGKGNGRPHSEASRHTPRPGRQPKGGPPAQDLSQVVKALARLALQQETSIKVLRQDTTWIILLQPGPISSLSLLFQVGQQWKQNQQRGAVDRPLRSVLIMCLLEHLHKLVGNMQEPLLNKAKENNWLKDGKWQYQTWSPSLGALITDDRDPLSNQDVVESDPSFGDPFHGQSFPCQWRSQGDEQQSCGLPTGDLQQNSGMPGCVAGSGEAQRPLSTSEALSRIRQLKLLNSNNTCYLNAFVLSCLHAITQTGCTEYAAFGSRSQAWRDVLYSGKPLHVHALPSWQGILEGWPDVHRQHDAGEMLEHWVAAGRPQVVTGRWEARIAEGMLVEIRHFATTISPINLDLPETAGTISLQQLVLEWHADQLGIQALFEVSPTSRRECRIERGIDVPEWENQSTPPLQAHFVSLCTPCLRCPSRIF